MTLVEELREVSKMRGHACLATVKCGDAADRIEELERWQSESADRLLKAGADWYDQKKRADALEEALRRERKRNLFLEGPFGVEPHEVRIYKDGAECSCGDPDAPNGADAAAGKAWRDKHLTEVKNTAQGPHFVKENET